MLISFEVLYLIGLHVHYIWKFVAVEMFYRQPVVPEYRSRCLGKRCLPFSVTGEHVPPSSRRVCPQPECPVALFAKARLQSFLAGCSTSVRRGWRIFITLLRPKRGLTSKRCTRTAFSLTKVHYPPGYSAPLSNISSRCESDSCNLCLSCPGRLRSAARRQVQP